MGVTRIPIAEARRDIDSVFALVRNGEQVSVDDGAESFVIQPAVRKGRNISESIRLLKEHQGRTGVVGYMDQEFAKDMEDVIAMRKPRPSVYDEDEWCSGT